MNDTSFLMLRNMADSPLLCPESTVLARNFDKSLVLAGMRGVFADMEYRNRMAPVRYRYFYYNTEIFSKQAFLILA